MNESGTCTLITASCTTGWFDWIHGELWLCPDGLLRRSLGLSATLGHRRDRTVDPVDRPTRTFTLTEIGQVVSADRRNRWLPWSAFSRATLKRGVIDHSLHMELGQPRREKFLWLRMDGGYDLLEMALGQALPGRFEAIDRPIG